MFNFNNRFIGYPICNQILYYTDTDSETEYNKNLKSQPNDWYYRNNPIEYSYNEFGHRSKNIDQLDFDNYMLFLGCSHTEGIGLHIENTYPHIVSKKLNCDYYNLSLGGSSLDVVFYNLLTWLTTFDKSPKAIVIQWPNIVRFPLLTEDNTLTNKGPWNTEKDISHFLVDGLKNNYFYTRSVLIYKMMSNLVKSSKLLLVDPIYEDSMFNDEIDHTIITYKNIDYARDMRHGGIQSHADVSQKILQQFDQILD